MLKSFAEIKALAKPHTAVVNVEQWGGEVTVREMTVDELLVFRQSESINKEEQEAQALVSAVECSVIDETGQQILKGQADWLRQQPASVLKVIAETALKLSGATPQQVDAQTKN